MALSVRFKHKVYFVEDGKPTTTFIGDVRSYSDSTFQGDLKVSLIDAVHEMDLIAGSSFFLGIKEDPQSKKLNDLVVYLESRPHRALSVQTLKGNIENAVARPMSAADLRRIGCPRGLQVTLRKEISDAGSVPDWLSNADKNVSNTFAFSSSATTNGSNQLPAVAVVHSKPEDLNPYAQFTGLGGYAGYTTTFNYAAVYANSTNDAYNASQTASNSVPTYNSPYSQQEVIGEEDRASKRSRVTFTQNTDNITTTATSSTAAASTVGTSKEQLQAENAYNSLTRLSSERSKSRIFHLRNLNNFVKEQLVDVACTDLPGRRDIAVLDLACGKGGDFFKWLFCAAGLGRFVGADLATGSLKDFVDNRLNDMTPEQRNKVQLLAAMDLSRDSFFADKARREVQCFTWSLDWKSRPSHELLRPEELQFDVATCQFAMHYMFSTRASAAHFFDEVSRCVNRGGRFIASTIDCRVLALYLRTALFGSDADCRALCLERWLGDQKADRGESEEVGFRIVDEDGRLLLLVRLQRLMAQRLLCLDLLSDLSQYREDSCTSSDVAEEDWREGFGLQYSFSLFEGDEGETAVNAPEWVVPLNTPFLHLLAQRKLRIRRAQNLQAFFTERAALPASLASLRSKGVGNAFADERMNAAEWSLARLYMVLVLQREGDDDEVLNVEAEEALASQLFAGSSQKMSSRRSHVVKTEQETSKRPKSPLSIAPPLPNTSFAPSTPPSSPPRFSPHSPSSPAPPPRTASYTSSGVRWVPLPPLRPTQGVFEAVQEAMEEVEDEEERHLLRVLAKCVELAGGEEAWEALDEDAADALKTQAELLLRT